MKKRLLLFCMAASIIGFNASAQLALENFNHGGALPTGWTMVSDGHTVSSSFAPAIPALGDSLDVHAWFPWLTTSSASDYQMLTTSLFSPTASADRWLITPSFTVTSPYTVLQWQDYDLNSGETIDVKVSPTAGVTPGSFTASLYSAPASPNQLTTHQVRIGSYNGSSITAAFHDGTNNNWGLEIDNVQTAIIDSYDLGVTAVYLAPFAQTSSSYPISGTLQNYGYNTITSMHLNYSVNGGTPVSTSLTGLTINLGGTYNYTSGTNWVPSTAGTYNIKVWADNINGAGVDQNHTNDTMLATVVVIDSLQPKKVLVEEFNQASCDPCALATPNLDSVLDNNVGITSVVRYHVDFPGRDCMDSVTWGSFVNTRWTYYNPSGGGVPDAQVDGQYVYPGAGYFTSGVLNGAAAFGSPFKITITPSFVSATQTYSFTASIKSFTALPSGIVAYAALTVDTITYLANQSTETIPQTVFPQVAENMFPGPGGTSLGAFTAGSTQTVTSSWVKNHPWGSDYSVWKYDSTVTGKIVVWVETANFMGSGQPYVYQSASAPVYTAHMVGVNAVKGAKGSLDLYPNPAGTSTTIALNLVEASDVKMEVYNTLGQVVYSMPSEHRNAGTSSSMIDVSNFANGEYFVKVMIGDEALTKTLVVTK